MSRSARNTLPGVVDALKLVTVEPYLFFCMLGYTVRLVTFQSLLMDGACRNWHLYPAAVCDQLDAHKREKEVSIESGNNLYSGVMLASSLPAILVAVFMGPWSDKYSRKYPLLIATAGMMVEGGISAVLSFYPRISPAWYVGASVCAGLSGGLIMSNSAAFSYLSDVTDERSRSARYAVLEFSSILSIVLGSSLGGQVFKAGGYRPVMMMAPVSFGLAILYTALAVKETKPRVEGLGCSDMMRDLVTLENIKDSYRTCSRSRPGNIRLQIWLLISASCSQKLVDMGTLAIAYFFAREMYSWDVTDFSHASTAFYVVNAFVTVVVIPILANKFRLQEAVLGLIGMLSLTAKMILTSVAVYPVLFYYAWFGGTLNNCTGIAVRSRLSKLVDKDELGRAFSLLGTCESVTPLLGTLVFGQVYNASSSVFPGLAFAASAFFLIPSILLFCWMIRLPTVSVGSFGRDDNVPATPSSQKHFPRTTSA